MGTHTLLTRVYIVPIFWKQMASLTNVSYQHILWPRNFTLRYTPNLNVWTCISRVMYKNGHSSIIHNSQRSETSQIFTNIRMDRSWHNHSMKYYVTEKMNKLQQQATMWMNLTNKILSAKSEAYNNSYCMNAYNTSSMKIIHIQTWGMPLKGTFRGLFNVIC